MPLPHFVRFLSQKKYHITRKICSFTSTHRRKFMLNYPNRKFFTAHIGNKNKSCEQQVWRELEEFTLFTLCSGLKSISLPSPQFAYLVHVHERQFKAPPLLTKVCICT